MSITCPFCRTTAVLTPTMAESARVLLADLKKGHAPLAAIAECPVCRREVRSQDIHEDAR